MFTFSLQEVRGNRGDEESTTNATSRSTSETIIHNQKQQESNARTYARHFELVLREAEGMRVTDVDGRTYLDCLSGAGTLALGHNHPQMIEAMRDCLNDKLPLHTLDMATPIKDRFVQTLFDALPAGSRGRWKVQFCSPSGADAVEAAMKLVKTATGRESMISFHGAYHGMTHGALSLTGSVATKTPIRGLMPGVNFMPYPYPYRCSFGLGDCQGIVHARYFERVLKDPESGIPLPAGVILEPVQGEGGVIPAPVHWLREVRRVTEELGIPLIVDEVQAGLGRTGHLFSFERAGIDPDVIILSKALGGCLPIAVILYKDHLDQWRTGAHTGTFRGNQLAMAAGTVTLKTIQQDGFLAEVNRKGDVFRKQLTVLQKETRCIGEIRQVGLMIGLEIINPEGPKDHLESGEPAGLLAQQIRKEALADGLIIELGGRYGHVVRLLPPLIITDAEIDQVMVKLSAAIRRAELGFKA